MVGKYEGLKEKYDGLSKLYIDILKQRGDSRHTSNDLAEGEDVEGPLLQDWRPQNLGLGEKQRDEMEVTGQRFAVSVLLWVGDGAGRRECGGGGVRRMNRSNGAVYIK